ncbi:hypothetical protein [Actinomadura rupiterrae]|uniref:hypothetical protein n=1 Tax=Actinomadura rupiterrae TaxID=559627 RepID=UPI0020A48159|nr:hypothetical protein [Actinomadura rupiterrae]MCP2335188.1 hypothetical protein [Actinomadura rupiterrae]
MFTMPDDEFADIRSAAVQGLRELADFLETRPGLPEPCRVRMGPALGGGTDRQRWDQVDRIARILGVQATRSRSDLGASRHYYIASRLFGAVEYQASATTSEPKPGHTRVEADDGRALPGHLDAPQDSRASVITGLRELADFLESHPDLPGPRFSLVSVLVDDGTDDQQRAEVDRIAQILGVEATDSAVGHYTASRSFGLIDNPGSVEYEATAITRPDPDFAGKTRRGALQGLAEFAAFLENHPDLPLPGDTDFHVVVRGGTDDQNWAEVDRIARILEVETVAPEDGQYVAGRLFGAMHYKAVAHTRERMARYGALMSYRGAVTVDPSDVAVTGACDRPAPTKEARQAVVQGLRELTDFLRAHPDLPIPDLIMLSSPALGGTTDEHQRAEVDRIAQILHVRIGTFPRGAYFASRRFGPIEYTAAACTRESRERRAQDTALLTYRDAVAPEPPAPAKT